MSNIRRARAIPEDRAVQNIHHLVWGLDPRYSSEYLLIELAETDGSESARLLRECGFDSKIAKDELAQMKMLDSPFKEYAGQHSFIIGISHAVAATFESKIVRCEHLLLALLHRHKYGAYALLGKLGVNRHLLQSRLLRLLRKST